MADLFPAGTGAPARVNPAAASNRALQAALEEDIAAVEARLLVVRRSAERTGLVERDPWWKQMVAVLDSILDRLMDRESAVQVEAWRESRRWV